MSQLELNAQGGIADERDNMKITKELHKAKKNWLKESQVLLYGQSVMETYAPIVYLDIV